MTKEYGAAVYLSTVVTEAALKSDEAYAPRYFVDNYCMPCKLCDKTCVAGMFDGQEEEQVLLNGELHPRAKRHAIDLCNASCFGLHSLSRDKKWTTWGRHWINRWVEEPPDGKDKKKLRKTLVIKGGKVGDSAARYRLIMHIGRYLWPEEVIDEFIEKTHEETVQAEKDRQLIEFGKKIGVKGLRNDTILTCGQCSLVCGPNLEETQKRYKLLIEGGLVVPGENGEMTHVDTYEEAQAIREKYPFRISRKEMIADNRESSAIWIKNYWGIEPKSIIQGLIYKLKLNRALKKQGASRETAS
jgi:hypothetical protein